MDKGKFCLKFTFISALLMGNVSTADALDCSSSSVLCVDDTAGANQEYSDIQAAVNVVRPGDTILVYDGSYRGFSLAASGTSSSRITLKAAGTAAVINQANSNGEGITLNNINYVTIEGLTVTGMPKYGLGTHNASALYPMRGLIIRNNRIQNSAAANIYLSQVAGSLIANNIASGSTASHGIYLANGGSDNTTLRGNRSFNNAKAGILFNGDASAGGDGYQTGLIVEKNIIYNNKNNGLSMDGVGDSVIQNNVVYNNTPHALRNYRIDAAQGPKNLKIINNTFLVPSGGEWAIKLTTDQGGHVIFNNILLNNGNKGSIVVNNRNLVSNNNVVTGKFSLDGEVTVLGLSQWQNQGYDKNSIASNSASVFINPVASDYGLKSGAPAIDQGLAAFNGVYAPSTDIRGIYRPQGRAHDIGAYESFYTSDGTADTMAPSITITTPTTASAYTASSAIFSLSGGASDNIGIAQVAWSNNRGGSGIASGTTSWSVSGIALQSGSNIITVTTRDAAGNTATDSLTVTYNVADTTNPTISIAMPSNGTSYSTTASSVALAGAASDNIGITQVVWSSSLGGSGIASGTTAWNVSGIALQTGSNTLTVTAQDAVGNTATDTLVVTYSTSTSGDTTAPSVTIASPTSAATYTTSSGTLILGGSATDNVGIAQVIWTNNRGGSGTASGTTSWSTGNIPLQSGSNIITVTARDAAGNQNTDTLTVTYNVADATSPAVTITSPTSSASYTASSATLSIGGTASDNVGVTQVAWSNSLSGSGIASGTTSWSVSSIALQSGSNIITVTTRDAAGNTATDSLTVTYTVADNSSCTSSTTLCVDDTAGASQEYSTIQAAVNVVRQGDTVLVYDGTYNGFTISANGAASNRILVKAEGSSAVINQANSNGEGITISNASYVTIEGFTVTGMSEAGIASHNASATNPMRGVIVRNNTVQNSGFMNIYMSQTADSLIEGNIASGSATSHGIYLANGGSDNTILRGNRCYNNFKNGIHFNGDSSIGGDGLHSGLTVENNILYNNNDNGVDADGVQDSVFQNNLMYGNGRNALRLFRIDSAQGPKNIKVINNTLIVPSGGGWAVKFSEDLGGHVIFNNILLSDNSSTGSISMPNTNFVSNNNALVGRLTYNGESSIVNLTGWQAAGFDANSFTTTSSSLFVNAGAGNYQLKAGAPAIDTGRISLNNVLAPLADIFSASRPQGVTFDMGAYESN